MIRKRIIEEEDQGKFSVGEEVYSKDNIKVKLIVLRYIGMRYYCGIETKNDQKEIMFFEDDLISEWQIPFFN